MGTIKVNDMLSGITGKTSMDAFKRMEEKVEALESAAEVSAEMGPILGGSSNESSLEAQFALLEASSAVDDELNRLKKGLLKEGYENNSKSLPAAESQQNVEDQFRQLEVNKTIQIPVQVKKEYTN